MAFFIISYQLKVKIQKKSTLMYNNTYNPAS